MLKCNSFNLYEVFLKVGLIKLKCCIMNPREGKGIYFLITPPVAEKSDIGEVQDVWQRH